MGVILDAKIKSVAKGYPKFQIYRCLDLHPNPYRQVYMYYQVIYMRCSGFGFGLVLEPSWYPFEAGDSTGDGDGMSRLVLQF